MAWPLPVVVLGVEAEEKEVEEVPAHTRLEVPEATTPKDRACSNFLTS
jgi:hypothetical protein